MGPEAGEDDELPFEEKMQELTAELAWQIEEGPLLEKRIWENLAGIGYAV